MHSCGCSGGWSRAAGVCKCRLLQDLTGATMVCWLLVLVVIVLCVAATGVQGGEHCRVLNGEICWHPQGYEVLSVEDFWAPLQGRPLGTTGTPAV